jgi:hypothetical protein
MATSKIGKGVRLRVNWVSGGAAAQVYDGMQGAATAGSPACPLPPIGRCAPFFFSRAFALDSLPARFETPFTFLRA